MTSNRSPSPLSSRNSETFSTTRRSFNGNPFALTNPKRSTDHTKKSSMSPKNRGLFQDWKENHKDAIRSPASRNFMAPTISAASKITPSPRKKILGDKNDITRATIQFLDKKSVQKVNLSLNSKEKLSDVEDYDFVKIRPSCCSPVDSGPRLPPYDSNRSFLSPGIRFCSYKPNPQIELLLNNEGNDVARLEESFNLSESLSETEEKKHEKDDELGDGLVVEDKLFDLKVEKASKPRFFKDSKTAWFVFVLFIVACFSLSFTDSPPIDLPIYEDVGFLEIYYGSLRFAAFAKESFDDLVEYVKHGSLALLTRKEHWLMGLV